MGSISLTRGGGGFFYPAFIYQSSLHKVQAELSFVILSTFDYNILYNHWHLLEHVSCRFWISNSKKNNFEKLITKITCFWCN